MRRLTLLIAFALATVPAEARTAGNVNLAPASVRADSSLAGHWEAQITGDSKIFTIAFDFAVKGGGVTGTVTLLSNDLESKITNGSFDGTNVAFTALGKFSGKLVGKELHLTRELDYGKKQQLVARRTPASKQK
jgi:hypothetical protein